MILKLPDPNATDLHYLQNYLETDSMGPLALLGRDASTWGSMLERDAHAPDLVALKVRAEKDALSTWAAKKVVGRLFTCCFKRFVKPSPGHGLVGVEDTLVYRATYGFTSLVASMVPIASIVVLYYVDSMPARLATIAVFNLFISICLMGLAKAKRAEIFAISAAYVNDSTLLLIMLTIAGLPQCRSSSLARTRVLRTRRVNPLALPTVGLITYSCRSWLGIIRSHHSGC